MIKAIIFDLDDLMVNSANLHIEASYIAFKKHGVDTKTLPDRVIASYFGKRTFEIQKLIAEYFKLDIPIEELIREREAIFLELAKKHLGPMPGLFELVRFLKTTNYRRAVASSGVKTYIDAALEKLGLNNFFEKIVAGDMVKMGKPDPEVFLKAAELLGVKPDESVVIEDSTAGIEAAKSAGMFCVAVKNPFSKYHQDLSRADVIVERLDKIDKAVLNSLGK